MAYISPQKKEEIKKKLEEYFDKEGYKGKIKYSLTVDNNRSIDFVLLRGPFEISDFEYSKDDYNNVLEGNLDINVYHFHLRKKNKESKSYKFIENIIEILNTDNYNNSDVQSDYFDVGHYISVKIGTYDKPYHNNQEMELKTAINMAKQLRERNMLKSENGIGIKEKSKNKNNIKLN